MISNRSVRVIEVFMIVSEQGQKLKKLTHSKTIFIFEYSMSCEPQELATSNASKRAIKY